MRISLATAALIVLSFGAGFAHADEDEWLIESLSPTSELIVDRSGVTTGTNGVSVKYGGVLLTAEKVTVNPTTGEALAEGTVQIQLTNQIWIGERVLFNFRTRQMETREFRTGKPPFFAAGEGLHGDYTNQTYQATNAFVTVDDVANPDVRIVTRRITVVPGKYIEAKNALLYVEGIPIFYFPYFRRNLDKESNEFYAIPGYRSSWGAFALGTYTWHLNSQLNGSMDIDYRSRIGPGGGPLVNYNFGRGGEGSVKYYYTYDKDPGIDSQGEDIGNNRQFLYFNYRAQPAPDFSVRSQVRYLSDDQVTRDFYESAYRENPQPSTYVDFDKMWSNFSLQVYTQPRVNDFLQTVERLPEVRLTGMRQQIGDSPIYYESDSSAGYFGQLYAETNNPPPGYPGNYYAARADTFQQLLLPKTFFGFLNVTPRVGGRFTYYSEATGTGATTGEEARWIFNTGAEVSFKTWKVWPNVKSKLFEADGIRHILEPSLNYAFVPNPSVAATNLPQFDYQLASLRQLPLDFPQYNSLDAIAAQNTLRFGLRNRLQTKRDGGIEDLLDWQLYADWQLDPQPGQETWSDVYSLLSFRPRSWLIWEAENRISAQTGDWVLANLGVSVIPNDVWSCTLAYYYLREQEPVNAYNLGNGQNLVRGTIYYRMNENWGLRVSERYNVIEGQMNEQLYSLFRDLRSWTAALSLRILKNPGEPTDVTALVTFQLKAFPRYGTKQDSSGWPYSMYGR